MKTFNLVLLCSFGMAVSTMAVPVSISSLNTPVTENFNTLANSGTANTTLPVGWSLAESGTSGRNNGAYAGDTGSDTAGDVYSYGAAGNSERAFGTLRSGTLIPIIGANFQNNSGQTITSLLISYTGEEWRLGTAGRADRLDFEISLNASDLNVGTWSGADAFDFSSPNTATVGAKDGNLAANRTVVTSSITGLNIAAGASFWIRWTDFDASGADDGLAIDDFSLTAQGAQSVPDSLPGVFAILALLGVLTIAELERGNRAKALQFCRTRSRK